MDTASDNSPLPSVSLAEGLTRTLRHEIGDFLQTVYSTTAILQARLSPGQELERKVVANLRARAESCKHLLDTLHDLVFPVNLALEPVSLAAIARQLVAEASARYPHLTVRTDSTEVPEIRGDRQRLIQAGNWLLENACQSARSQVDFQTRAGPGEGAVSWIVTDDGADLTPVQRQQLFDAFTISRRGTLGLGLGALRKVVSLHGGRVEATNRDEGGLCVQVELPRAAPASNGRSTPN